MLAGYKVIYSTESFERDAGFPDAERKWFQLFGERLDTDMALKTEDLGDTMRYLMPNGHIVEYSCGNDETIYAPLETAANVAGSILHCPECLSDDLVPRKQGTAYDCKGCGLSFLDSEVLELRLLPPQPAPSLSDQTLEEYNRGGNLTRRKPMATETLLTDDDPRMQAWKAYSATDEFANSKKWAVHTVVEHPHVDGSLWAIFVAGYEAGMAAAKKDGE